MTKIKPNPNEKTDFKTDFPNLSEIDFEKELTFVSRVLDKFEPSEEKQQNQSWNSLDFFGLSVSSQTEPLKKVEETLHRIIAKHESLFKHQFQMRTGFYQ